MEKNKVIWQWDENPCEIKLLDLLTEIIEGDDRDINTNPEDASSISEEEVDS